MSSPGDRSKFGLPPSPGGFVLLEKIGRGQSSEVWRAEQIATGRTVAVKFLAPALGCDAAQEAQFAWRFQREIEAIAQFDHPHIAQIHASGVTEGRPWSALEFVEGLPIDAHADAHALTPRERIALFQRVCEGAQHAHEHGIIHRNFKPGNIFVRADGTPKILDFGLARFLEESGFGLTLSHDGEAIGTPMFMAPEQAAGKMSEVGIPADVHALGVILYRLTTGGWPFDETLPPLQLLTAVRDTEPRPPRGLDRDLAAIVLKAIAKSKDDRYASVRALSDDLTHYLASEPVSARAPTLGYVFSKQLRKHRRAAIATLTALVITAGLGTAWLVERRRAEARNARALQQAKELINAIVFEMRGRLEPLGMTDVLADATERVARFPWELGTDASGEFDLRRFEALAASVRGDVHTGKGEYAEALAAYRKSATLLDEVAREHPKHTGLLAESATAQITVNRAMDLIGVGDEPLNSCRQLLEKLKGNADGKAVAALALPRMQTHLALGEMLVRRRLFAEAEAEIQQALAVAVPPSLNIAPEAFTAELQIALGDARLGIGRSAEALTAYSEAEKQSRLLIARNGDSLRTRNTLARSLVGRATSLTAQGELSSALKMLDGAFPKAKQTPAEGEAAGSAPSELLLVDCFYNLGRTLVRRGQDAAAIEALNAATRLFDSKFPQEQDGDMMRKKRFAILQETARAYLRLGRPWDAAHAFDGALRHAKEINKTAVDKTPWLLTILDLHIERLCLPVLPRGPSDLQRHDVIQQCFRLLDDRAGLTDSQRRTLEEMRVRYETLPPREPDIPSP